MDTKEDFVFLLEHAVERFNPYQEGEYLVVQTRSGWRLHPLHRGFDYRTAKSFCELENMGSDYNHYSVRIIQQGKLHYVDCDGAATKLSKEQDWKIHEDYYNARYVENSECDIEVCSCSYPVFWSYKTCFNSDKEAVEVWHPVTCLVNDNDREIENCPNCGARLIEEDEEDESWEEEYWEEAPEPCKGCKYYGSDSPLLCAVHPYGPVNDICPDYLM
ncbi:hypothetical protein NIES4071_106770 (plasmid) [Calothrix sp. NIES-4071]|nr:hypothetical protein NIES4071_106770 [Calothrix sp. NIES-4071]BAZ65095.1 hypothetical protein NIES4105_108280 [Calothrix sp. NIES-4105]